MPNQPSPTFVAAYDVPARPDRRPCIADTDERRVLEVRKVSPQSAAALVEGIEPEPRVLLVEDDRAVSSALAQVLTRYGMRTALASTMAGARELKDAFAPTVVLVDLHLPDGNGMELVRWLAQAGDCGIVVLTGDLDIGTRVAGLDIGADDYIAKPPSNRELIARIRAVHRRVLAGAQATPPAEPVVRLAARSEWITISPVRINLRQHRATDGHGRRMLFSAAEFAVLGALAAADGEVVSQEALCEIALHRPLRAEDRSVSQLIHGIRRKLAGAGADDQVIQTARAAGYALRLPDPA